MRSAGVVAVATGAGVLGWAVERGLDVPLRVETSGTVRAVGVVSVVLAALVSGVAAVVARALLLRRRGGRRAWWLLCWAALLLSLVLGPLAGTTTATQVSLAVLHVLVGVTLMVGLRPGTERTADGPTREPRPPADGSAETARTTRR
ncbi:DUF6069 family protein [Luteipulveratus flavus]|uniref:DUF6069 family protein n=1 Tax=Luteipulveratus flavus TaxID=3031728 RepID=A0ABT6C8Q2_9MICO|nr:DUF6069 family protein [Luteipulveratus sp. YIM 133296]MDF8265265.1 DUF6069 family protein [Luteipulveratus sp. YIM 133296]